VGTLAHTTLLLFGPRSDEGGAMVLQMFRALAAVVLLLGLSGCGGSPRSHTSASTDQRPRLSYERFTHRANAICAVENARIDKLDAILDKARDRDPTAIPKLVGRIRLASIIAEDAIRRLRPPKEIQGSVHQALAFEEHGDILTIQLIAAMSRGQLSQFRKLRKQVRALDDKAGKIEYAIGLTTCAFEAPPTRLS
jgi:hypothetical protein